MPTLEVLWGSVFDALDCGIIVLDNQQCVVGWNAWLQSTSGIGVADALGKRIEDIFSEAPVRRVKVAIAAALAEGSPTLITHSLNPRIFPLKTRAGQPLIHNLLVGPLGPTLGSHCLLQIMDVTLAVERERVLRRRQNTRYDAVVNSAPDVILTLDANSDIQLANPAALRQFGYSSQELIGRPASLLSQDPTAWDATLRAITEGFSLHQPLDVEARRKDGSVAYLEVSFSRWISDRIYEYAGLPVDHLNWRLIIHPEDFEAAAELWASALRTGDRYEVEARLRRADSVYRWHVTRAVPIRDNTGEIARWIGTNSDIEDQ